MQSFEFSLPTKIIFGEASELKIASVIREYGCKKVLIVYGEGSIKQNGIYERVVRKLIKEQLFFSDFGGAVPNPTLEHVRDGIEWARKNEVDSILAIGGGSVIDTAKAIAVGCKYDADVWKLFTGEATCEDALPVFCVLTLAATGSESNGSSVITNEAEHAKLLLRNDLLLPVASAMNPALSFSVGAHYSAVAAVDALSHILEVYFTKESDFRLNDRLSEALIKSIMKSTEKILKEPENFDARAEFMWCASLALNGLLTCGVGQYEFINHALARPLSALFNVSHGESLAVILPAWLKIFADKNPKRVFRFSKKIFNVKTAQDGIEAFENWLHTIGIQTTLESLSLSEADIPKLVDNCLAFVGKSKGYHDFDRRTITDIYMRTLAK